MRSGGRSSTRTDPRALEDLRAELTQVAAIRDELDQHFALARVAQRHGIKLAVLRRAMPDPDPATRAG
ncbi:hypothetical protein ACHFJ0_00520 [Paracoccus sp. NGMCC 1.201697]|uniref:Uncharacterized protein n=1 Tax=Paracoccus broussonetiae subsp. drimophilus TaxID=3373869 RepID=A0ABW7LIE5_9RHOB